MPDKASPKTGLDFKVVIIGAGACGLQCAHDLITKHEVDPDDILILEARNRIGGRIYTTRETRVHPETGKEIQFAVDHGACWVHGTGMEWNAPVPDLLAASPDSSVASSSDSASTASLTNGLLVNPIVSVLSQINEESVYSQLEPIFVGNPWMRPKTVVVDQRQLALFCDGQRLDADEEGRKYIQESLNRHFDVLEALSEVGKELFQTGQGMEAVSRSADEFIDRFLPQKRKDGQSSDSQLNLVASLAPFYMHLLECWHGAPVKDLQLAAFITDDEEHLSAGHDHAYDSEYTSVGDFFGPHCTVKEGMETVLQPLLDDGVRDRIILEQEVTKIRYHAGQHIVIETALGENVHCATCVSTMTVECLKQAVRDGVFEPTLCAEKEEAISMTQMGCYKKVLLTFTHIFWPEKESFIGLVSGRARSPLGKYLLMNNLWSRRGIPCLEAILFGESGQWATGKADQLIRDVVLDFMRVSMNLNEDMQSICSEVHVTRWEEDRFSRGAYSNICLGASQRHIEEIRRPEYDGRLHLAGEGTNYEYEGSVHAALLSGRDAAEQVQAVLSRLPLA